MCYPKTVETDMCPFRTGMGRLRGALLRLTATEKGYRSGILGSCRIACERIHMLLLLKGFYRKIVAIFFVSGQAGNAKKCIKNAFFCIKLPSETRERYAHNDKLNDVHPFPDLPRVAYPRIDLDRYLQGIKMKQKLPANR